MAANFYALLVGINQYAPSSNISPLKGCENDLTQVRTYLVSHVSQWRNRWQIKNLLNDEATYRNVVQAFNTHFAKAKSGDTVLFYFSGYGSKEQTEELFANQTGVQEQATLVCYDSRTEGGHDLGWLELQALVAALAQGVKAVVITDAGHEVIYGKTADDLGRCAAKSLAEATVRSLAEYAAGFYERQYEAERSIVLPEIAAVHFRAAAAGCNAYEVGAKEANKVQGAFTRAMLEVLNVGQDAPSYQAIAEGVQVGLQELTFSQRAAVRTMGYFDAFGKFGTNEATAGGTTFGVFYDDGEVSNEAGWKIKGGALNGIASTPDAPAQFVLLGAGGEALGTAEALNVGLHRTTLALTNETNLEAGSLVKARLVSVQPQPYSILLTGSGAVREVVLNYFKNRHSPLVRLVEGTAALGMKYEFNIENNSLDFKNLLTKTYLLENELIDADAMFALAEDAAKWERLLKLANPASYLTDKEVSVEMVTTLANGSMSVMPLYGNEGEVVVRYERQEGEWRSVPFELLVSNRAGRQLHTAVFYMGNDLSVSVLKALVMDAYSTEVVYADSLVLDADEDTSIEVLKFLFSTEPIDAESLEQQGLEAYYNKTRDVDAGGAVSKLQPNTWIGKTLSIKVIRESYYVHPLMPVVLNGKLTVQTHPSLIAEVGIETLNTNTRDVEGFSALATHLLRTGGILLSLTDAHSRNANEITLVNLSNIHHAETVTPTKPLVLAVETTLSKYETIVPITFDGEVILPIGGTYNTKDGYAMVNIERLPKIQDGTRSITQSLKLFLCKITTPTASSYLLRVVNFEANGQVTQIETGVALKVAKAKKVLVVIHGILGNTHDIVKHLGILRTGGKYDLVLSFDYENLHTPIEETANNFKKALTSAGFGENDSKELVILAHSMGGLVSRHFIERLGGNKMVNQLVLCGTPNAGSRIADVTTYRDVAIPLLTLAMNFSLGIPSILVAGLKGSQQLTRTLEQMHPESDFLFELNASPDPSVPYTIIIGDLDAFVKSHHTNRTLLRILDVLSDLISKEKENDIAVSVQSIKSVKANRNPSPKQVSVAAHHLNYFEPDGSLEAVLAAL